MLVLSRKVGESILLDKDIRITDTELRGHRVKIGIQASTEVSILRGEHPNRQGLANDLVAVGSSAIRRPLGPPQEMPVGCTPRQARPGLTTRRLK